MKALLPLLFLLPFAATADQKAEEAVDLSKLAHPKKACLFKVEGNGLKKPSYLFGTIHLSDPRVVNLHPNAKAAFKDADAFYAEVDLDPAAQLQVAMLVMRKDGKKLTEAIGPELTKKLQKVLKGINPALDTASLETFKTWGIAVTLPTLKDQLSGKIPLDLVLFRNAQKANKTVGALESAEGQIGVFDKFNEEEQLAFLTDSLDAMLEDQDAEVTTIERLLNVYLTGTVTEIAEFMRQEMAKADTNPEFSKRLMKALLDDRNVGMADKADEFMQANPDQSHFFAVGAAHYTGNLAVQDLLKKKGYTITPAFE